MTGACGVEQVLFTPKPTCGVFCVVHLCASQVEGMGITSTSLGLGLCKACAWACDAAVRVVLYMLHRLYQDRLFS